MKDEEFMQYLKSLIMTEQQKDDWITSLREPPGITKQEYHANYDRKSMQQRKEERDKIYKMQLTRRELTEKKIEKKYFNQGKR